MTGGVLNYSNIKYIHDSTVHRGCQLVEFKVLYIAWTIVQKWSFIYSQGMSYIQ
jgi:hypothetical protein